MPSASDSKPALKEGYDYDFATGKPVDIRKPEEKVRQAYERTLNDDYDYELGQMDIEVQIQRGSKTKPKGETDFADIVIYKTADKSKHDQNRDIFGIVETKRRERKDGVRQLMSYMSASSCEWGVWTNGEEIGYIYKDLQTGEIKPDYIFQIPRKGETFEDIGKLSKKDLIPAKNLKGILGRMLNTLYTNTNISRREKLGNELTRLIFCKIWDEKYYTDKPPRFKVGFRDKPEDVKASIETLFSEVKAELVGDGVFDANEEIKLDAKSVAYAVGELERYSLLKTDKDVVGDAFEVFAESKLVGEKGEFFTPREVVKTAIELVHPKPGQRVFDPACGSGGFLIYALEHVWREMENSKKYRGSSELERMKREVAEKCFFGIDKEIDLVKIAKAYMAIVGDGRGGIVQQNTLHRAEDYDGKARELFTRAGKFKKFDVILTNPPFGSKIKVLVEESASFQLGHVWKRDADIGWVRTQKEKATEPQVLFIERCLEMLEDKGTLAIVLPETYFHAPKVRYVLDFIRRNNNIKAIVDLAHNTFRPHNNAKTLLLVLEKAVPQQQKILMAVAEEIGHDGNGKPLHRFDYKTWKFTNEIWDDTLVIRSELKNPENPSNRNVFVVDIKDIKNDVFVPRYYWKTRTEELRKAAEKQGLEFVKVSELIKNGILMHSDGHGSPPAEFKGKGDYASGGVPYVRVADIVNWEAYKNPTAIIPKSIYLEIKGNGIDLHEKDV
ncbi:N-6 DNA methylase, partial [Candidatus Micrarchaeota archaeon]|nr:N-6 DNA methylase [Candidatus Micrarchaeota archaeon]